MANPRHFPIREVKKTDTPHLTIHQLAKLLEDKELFPIQAFVVCEGETISMKERLDQLIAAATDSPQRILTLYKRSQEALHWTVIDYLMTDKLTKIFYLDSAGDPRNLDSLLFLWEEKFGNKYELTTCEGELQNTSFGCQAIATNQLFHLAKLSNIHTLLEQKRKPHSECEFYKIDLSPKPDMSQQLILRNFIKALTREKRKTLNKSVHYAINPIDLPPTLVKTAQSFAFIEKYLAHQPEQLDVKINKRNQTLMEYVIAHGIFSPTFNKEVNYAFVDKANAYIKRC